MEVYMGIFSCITAAGYWIKQKLEAELTGQMVALLIHL